MSKKFLLTAAMAAILTACSGGTDTAEKVKSEVAKIVMPDGMTKVESVSKTGDEIVIPYKKFKMDNGLTVVLHQDNPIR